MYESSWRVEPTLMDCPIAPKRNLQLDKIIYDKAKYLDQKVPDTEWLVYIIGSENDKEMIAKDLIIPKQTVNYSEVVRVEYPNNPAIIGTIHSHHNFGSFFSGTDQTHLMGNHDLTIVISNEKITVSTRVKAPCGGYCRIDLPVEFVEPQIKTSYLQILFNFIHKKKPISTELVSEEELKNITIQKYEPIFPAKTLLNDTIPLAELEPIFPFITKLYNKLFKHSPPVTKKEEDTDKTKEVANENKSPNADDKKTM